MLVWRWMFFMPENGIDYASWLGAVAQNPAIEGRELGRIICDTYMTRCQQYEAADMANMSVLDMEKLPASGHSLTAMSCL